MENTLLVQKMFAEMKKSLDIKTKLLPFESFIELMATFKSTDVTEKIDRLFKIIDEDGNGNLSYEEICEVVTNSLSTYTNIWENKNE